MNVLGLVMGAVVLMAAPTAGDTDIELPDSADVIEYIEPYLDPYLDEALGEHTLDGERVEDDAELSDNTSDEPQVSDESIATLVAPGCGYELEDGEQEIGRYATDVNVHVDVKPDETVHITIIRCGESGTYIEEFSYPAPADNSSDDGDALEDESVEKPSSEPTDEPTNEPTEEVAEEPTVAVERLPDSEVEQYVSYFAPDYQGDNFGSIEPMVDPATGSYFEFTPIEYNPDTGEAEVEVLAYSPDGELVNGDDPWRYDLTVDLPRVVKAKPAPTELATPTPTPTETATASPSPTTDASRTGERGRWNFGDALSLIAAVGLAALVIGAIVLLVSWRRGKRQSQDLHDDESEYQQEAEDTQYFPNDRQ